MSGGRRALVALLKSWPWLALATALGFWFYSRVSGEGLPAGPTAEGRLRDVFLEPVQVLPPMFLLIGLFEVWVPRRIIERYLGEGAGAAAIPWVMLLAMIQMGPLYAAYPVAMSLWRKGCTPRNVFIYLGAFTTAKIPMVGFEVAFLGWRFSLARVLLTIPVFILVSVATARLLPEGYDPPGLNEEPMEGSGDGQKKRRSCVMGSDLPKD